MAPYRPPGRSNRSGRAQAESDVFEGLPVKQWGQAYARVSLAPPVAEIVPTEDDRWGEPPMPRDFQFLQPWTQHLLRLARGGKIGTKRKADAETGDDEKVEDELAEELKHNSEDRGFVAKKWKPVPEAMLEPEHKRFEFLAKRRKGLPSLYNMELQSANVVPMRKTKVLKANADGDVTMYEVLVPEGQSIEGEVSESTEIADIKPTIAAPGTVVEGLGIANDEGVIVAEHLKPAANSRRSRPPKKKGGPGRGKKRVTFTNPDGSTYTTVVPNATKIVPQPGQTVKHVAKGEEAGDDVTAEEAAKLAPSQSGNGGADGAEGDGEDGEGDDGEDDEDEEDGDEGDDDDDREEGELSDEDAPMENATPAKPSTTAMDAVTVPDVAATKTTIDKQTPAAVAGSTDIVNPAESAIEAGLPEPMDTTEPPRDTPSSPELPLAGATASTQDALSDIVPGQAEGTEVFAAAGPYVETGNAATVETGMLDATDEQPTTEAEISAAVEELPLAVAEEPAVVADTEDAATNILEEEDLPKDASLAAPAKPEDPPAVPIKDDVEATEEVAEDAEDAEDDLLGNFEKQLDGA